MADREDTARWRPVRLAVLVLLVAGTVAAVAVAWTTLAARGPLVEAAEAMVDGRERFLRGDVTGASASFARSEDAFTRARDRTSGPLGRLGAAVPLVGRSPATAAALADSGLLVARASGRIAAGVDDVGGVVAVAPRDGRIPLEPLEGMHQPLVEARQLIEQAGERFEQAPDALLPPPVATARATFAEQLEIVGDAVHTGEALTAALPAFLGADGPRRYFFGASNPAEIRGTGGFIGAYSILTVDDGELGFEEFESIGRLPHLYTGEVEAPRWDYAQRYNRFGGAAFMQNINMTPDFPTAALAIRNLYEEGVGEDLDGVVVADPETLAALLRTTGPTEVPDIGTVEADTVVEFLAVEAYDEFDDRGARKPVLGEVAASVLDTFLAEGGDADPREVLEALAPVAGGGHLLFDSADADTQAALDAAGLTGRVPDVAGDFLGVVVNNAGANKVDYYVERSVRYEVWLADDGSATGSVAVTFANDAPSSGRAKTVLGPNVDWVSEPGQTINHVSLFCARSCTFGDEVTGAATVEEELGYPVMWTWEWLRAQDAHTIAYTVDLEEAWWWDDGHARYELTVLDQPTVRPSELEVIVHPPSGMEITASSPDAEVDAGTATWQGEVEVRRRMELEFGPPRREMVTHTVAEYLRNVRDFWRSIASGSI